MLYDFDEVDDQLTLLPMAARRALDWAGCKLSLVGWQSLALDARKGLIAAGAEPVVDTAAVLRLIGPAIPPAEHFEAEADPVPDQVPAAIGAAFGAEHPISDGAWRALSPLDRFALAKVAQRGRPNRLSGAYGEIIGESQNSPHLSARGGVRMVDIGAKEVTQRAATARSFVAMNAEAFARLSANNPKGDVLGTARLAAIIAAKKTSDWIPLCHPLALTKVEVNLQPSSAEPGVVIEATVHTVGRTGVEMEALTAASAAALTVYDMLKAFDKSMSIGPTVLVSKSGAKRRLPEVLMFEIRDTPLSVDECMKAVARAEAGAIDIFIGTVRDHNGGLPVSVLEYEAYRSMAEKEMAAVGAAIESEFAGVRVACLHRTGELRVGDIAVVCAASAPHRDEAFRACRELIDRIKDRAPIWKREHGPDGPYWVGFEHSLTKPGG